MIEKYNHLYNQLPYLSYLLLLSALMIGIVIGFVAGSFTFHNGYFECRIEFISRDEIISLEKARVARVKDKQLFFGREREAVNLIQSIAKARNNTGSHVIFTKNSNIKGKGVVSISEEIHREVINALKNSINSDNVDENAGGVKDYDGSKKPEVNEDGESKSGKDSKNENNSNEHKSKDVISPTMKLLDQLDKGEKWQDLQ